MAKGRDEGEEGRQPLSPNHLLLVYFQWVESKTKMNRTQNFLNNKLSKSQIIKHFINYIKKTQSSVTCVFSVGRIKNKDE
ncbi:hypothetical protein HYC85_006594 [Camellia sinensis]|uniref:Uncharacterized protein n=1 Tax=Camellia sinensis TaxID=4442 RepID=A0A7J7HP23_CAMSI|nr:hypothetical protein HYC85_006594 [Camellia sinensis]